MPQTVDEDHGAAVERLGGLVREERGEVVVPAREVDVRQCVALVHGTADEPGERCGGIARVGREAAEGVTGEDGRVRDGDTGGRELTQQVLHAEHTTGLGAEDVPGLLGLRPGAEGPQMRDLQGLDARTPQGRTELCVRLRGAGVDLGGQRYAGEATALQPYLAARARGAHPHDTAVPGAEEPGQGLLVVGEDGEHRSVLPPGGEGLGIGPDQRVGVGADGPRRSQVHGGRGGTGEQHSEQLRLRVRGDRTDESHLVVHDPVRLHGPDRPLVDGCPVVGVPGTRLDRENRPRRAGQQDIGRPHPRIGHAGQRVHRGLDRVAAGPPRSEAAQCDPAGGPGAGAGRVWPSSFAVAVR
ncbi:hypothetical protein SMICM17S_08135 [Streptomyces microflavus]